MKKILVLPTFCNLDEVIATMSENVDITGGRFNNLEFHFHDNTLTLLHAGEDMKNFAAVWLSAPWSRKDQAYAVRQYLEDSDTTCTYVEKGTSKLTDQVLFAKYNINSPNTFFAGNTELTNCIIEGIEATCGYPLIIKDVRGTRGKHSMYVENRQQLIEKNALLPKDKRYLYQQFIANDYDWGILVANGKIVSAEQSHRLDSNEFRNRCLGASTEEIIMPIDQVPEHIKTIALRASSALKLNWSRSDIVVDKYTQAPYLLEVNRSPRLSSETTEIDGARMFLQEFVNEEVAVVN